MGDHENVDRLAVQVTVERVDDSPPSTIEPSVIADAIATQRASESVEDAQDTSIKTANKVEEAMEDKPSASRQAAAVDEEIAPIAAAGLDTERAGDEENERVEKRPSEEQASAVPEDIAHMLASGVVPPEKSDKEPSQESEPRGDSESALPTTASAETELARLRQLVMATRGAAAQPSLPPEFGERVSGSVDAAELNRDQRAGDTSLKAAEKETSGDAVAPVEDAEAKSLLEKTLDKMGRPDLDVVQDGNESSDEEDEESSSSSASSSSSSSSSDEEDKDVKGNEAQKPSARRRLQKRAAAARNDADIDEDDDEGGGGDPTKGPRTKNEVVETTIDEPPFNIVPSELEKRPLGKVHSIVDSVVVVAQETGRAPGQPASSSSSSSSHAAPASVPVDMRGKRGEQQGEYSVLDTGSVLCFEDGNVLGVVFETFGSVLAPLYALRFADSAKIDKSKVWVGREVLYVPGASTYVLTRQLRAMGKGSDASNLWDEEVGDDEMEFSDDEAEAEYKRQKKLAKGGGGAKGKGKRLRPEEEGAASSSLATYQHPDYDAQSSASIPLPYDDAASAGDSSYQQGDPTQNTFNGAQRGRGGGGMRRPNFQRGRGRGRGRGGMMQNHLHPQHHQPQQQQQNNQSYQHEHSAYPAYNPAMPMQMPMQHQQMPLQMQMAYGNQSQSVQQMAMQQWPYQYSNGNYAVPQQQQQQQQQAYWQQQQQQQAVDNSAGSAAWPTQYGQMASPSAAAIAATGSGPWDSHYAAATQQSYDPQQPSFQHQQQAQAAHHPAYPYQHNPSTQ